MILTGRVFNLKIVLNTNEFFSVSVLALTYIYHGDTISMHICRHILLIFKVIRCNTIYYAITKD